MINPKEWEELEREPEPEQEPEQELEQEQEPKYEFYGFDYMRMGHA